jgi:sigma-B regulation protein RsbU (phosphoserine phosphatase)
MSIRTGLLVICAAIFVLIAGSLYVVSRALDTQSDIAQAEVRRYHSYKLADELRQSSDDLTRMARLYVVTGDTRYRTYFEQIVAIRDGEAPRPLDYGNVYWDFVVAWGKPPRRDDKPIALEQLMHDAHFTDDELAFLRQAKSRSDALVALESRAMHAVQGRFLDDRGQFTRTGPPDMEFARRLMNGPEYHRAKAEIMTPIHDFLGRVESRTAAEVIRLRRRGERLHLVAIAGLGTAVVLVLVSFVLLARPRLMAFLRGADPGSGGPSMAGDQGRTPGRALWTAWPLLAAAAAACASVLMLSWWLSENIEERVRGDIRNALETVHQTTARSVDDWLTEVTHEVGAWARSPLVRDVVTPPGRGRKGGELLTPLSSLPGFAGYLILDLAGRIVSSDDRGLLTRTVTRELGEGLSAAVDQSPDHAIVVFPDGRRPEPSREVTFPRDIVVAAAVRGDRDRVAGLLLLRFDPRLDLSRILDRGRLGESGQSYAFDRGGRRLVESRFGRPVGPEGQALSTRMALTGRSGLNVDGYRDYRGVPVIGAWTWNEHYDIGIATEVGLDEAYGALAGYQRQTRLGTGLAVLLIVALSGLFAWNRLAMAAASAKLESAHAIIRGHKERMEEELRVGHDLQLSMVPRTFPAFPKRDDISVYATLRPARELGGDFYDFFFVDADHLFFCVGDVSDKGVPAALFMAAARTLIRARSADHPSPASLVTYVNAELARDNDACLFVTLFAGQLDTTNGDLVYTNAGHDPPYVRGVDGSLQRLEERHGPLAGAAPGVVYGESRRRLALGDVLVAFTDGVTEARDASARFFSEERAAEAVRTSGDMSAAAVVDRLVSAVEAFTGQAEQADDITILALQFRPPSHVAVLDADLPPVETVVIHNRPADLEAVEAVLDRLAERARVPSDTMSQVRVVCDEVLANVIAHGFPDEAEHEIEVSVAMGGRRLVLTVSDDGVPFDPLTVPPPDTSQPLEQRPIGGLGIHLVRHLVDEVAYERRGDRNVLTLVKAVDRRPPALEEGAEANETIPDTGTSGARDTDGRGDAQMEIRTRRLGDVLIADMVGRLDSRTAGPASTELNQIAQGGHGKLVLNVHGLEYVSSAGLRAILVAAKLIQVHGGAMKICDANATVKHVMEVSGMSSLLHLYDTEKDALAAFA